MARQNFYATKLQNQIGSSDTTLVVQTPPTVTSGRLVLEPRNAQQREIIAFTGVSGTSLTGVTRGIGGTTAKTHPAQALIEMNIFAEDIDDVYTALSSFTATNNDWRVIPGTPVIASTNGQREFVVNMPGDQTAILAPGHKARIPRTGTTPTQSAAFVAASSQYASRAAPTGITFTDDFTCEAWVYLDSYPTNGGSIVSRINSAGSQGWQLWVSALGRVSIEGYNTDFRLGMSYQSIPLNTWIHIAGTIDMSAGTAVIYINGVAVPTEMKGAATALVQAGDLQISNYTSNTKYISGKISNVRVWNTIRTAQQIRDNMNQQIPGTSTGLVASYMLNGSWNDTSGNANHLSAVNGAVNNFADNPFKANEFGIVTKVGAFSGGVTPLTIFTGQSNTIPNETLGQFSYSTARTPFGFPADTGNWTVEACFSAAYTYSIGNAGTYYPTAFSVTMPSGKWDAGVEGSWGYGGSAAAGAIKSEIALSTRATSTTVKSDLNTKITAGAMSLVSNSVRAVAPVSIFEPVTNTSQSVYYLFGRVHEAAGSFNLYFNEVDSVAFNISLIAKCPYI